VKISATFNTKARAKFLASILSGFRKKQGILTSSQAEKVHSNSKKDRNWEFLSQDWNNKAILNKLC
jgi:hypothetical protein